MRGPEVKYDQMVLPSRLTEAGVEVRVGCEVTAVGARRVLVCDGDRGPREEVADWTVLALGREPSSSTLSADLEAAGVDVVEIGSMVGFRADLRRPAQRLFRRTADLRRGGR